MLQEFIQEDPKDPFNHYALAMEYYEEDPPQSMELLHQLLSDHPDYLPTYFKAANLLWDLEQWEDADQTFQKGIGLAMRTGDTKAEKELKASYQNFQFERD